MAKMMAIVPIEMSSNVHSQLPLEKLTNVEPKSILKRPKVNFEELNSARNREINSRQKEERDVTSKSVTASYTPSGQHSTSIRIPAQVSSQSGAYSDEMLKLALKLGIAGASTPTLKLKDFSTLRSVSNGDLIELIKYCFNEGGNSHQAGKLVDWLKSLNYSPKDFPNEKIGELMKKRTPLKRTQPTRTSPVITRSTVRKAKGKTTTASKRRWLTSLTPY